MTIWPPHVPLKWFDYKIGVKKTYFYSLGGNKKKPLRNKKKSKSTENSILLVCEFYQCTVMLQDKPHDANGQLKASSHAVCTCYRQSQSLKTPTGCCTARRLYDSYAFS